MDVKIDLPEGGGAKVSEIDVTKFDVVLEVTVEIAIEKNVITGKTTFSILLFASVESYFNCASMLLV